MTEEQAAVLVDERNPVFTMNASEKLNMSNADIHQLYGGVHLAPREEVVAGSYGTWTLTYTAGKKGVATGGRIRIYTDSDSDRATPQMDDPAGADYLTIEAPKAARIGVLVQSVLSVVLIVNGRALQPGEQVAVTYGDRREGGLGFRAQTFQEARHYFWVDVDTAGDGNIVTLPEPPHLSIVGGEAEKLVVNVPSMVVSGEQFQIQIRAEDAWGNPAAAYRGLVAIQSVNVRVPTEQLRFGEADKGVQWIDECTVMQTGIHRLTAVDEKAGLTAQSNPTLCKETKAPYNLYWGILTADRWRWQRRSQISFSTPEMSPQSTSQAISGTIMCCPSGTGRYNRRQNVLTINPDGLWLCPVTSGQPIRAGVGITMCISGDMTNPFVAPTTEGWKTSQMLIRICITSKMSTRLSGIPTQ